jgi:glyoxylase-like metal-dependent hydrolase (beta-lactamase superfamily II)
MLSCNQVVILTKLDILIQGSGLRTNLGSLGICTIALIREKKITLVDTGHFGNRRQILQGLKHLNISPLDIDNIILTHSHWDHSLNLELFRDATVFINFKELAYARSVKGDDWATPMTLGMIIESMKTEIIKGDANFSDDVKIIYSPGHSPGHQSVLVRTDEGNMLLTGDAMPTLRSYFRGLPDYIGTSEDEARQSITKLKALQPDVYYPGHDRPFRIVDMKPEYLAHSEIKIIVRRETEENFGIILSTEAPEKPEKV